LDHVILLTVPSDIAMARMAKRNSNDYGKQSDDLRRELHLRVLVEPRLQAGALMCRVPRRSRPRRRADGL
jgi:hypothetical protein